MENKEEKLDQLSRRIMKDAPLETPSFGFEQRLMRQIESQKTRRQFTVFKRWFLLGWISCIMLLIILWFQGKGSKGWFDFFEGSFSIEDSISLSVDFVQESNTIFYSIISLVLIVVIQTVVLKRLFTNYLRS